MRKKGHIIEREKDMEIGRRVGDEEVKEGEC